MTQSLRSVERGSTSMPGISPQALYECGQLLLSRVSSSVVFLNQTGHIEFANPSAEAMLGYSTSSLAGLEFAKLFEPSEEDDDPSNRPPAPAEVAIPTGDVTRRGTLICRNGVRLPVRVDLALVTNGMGKVLASVATIDDLSDYMQMSEYVRLMADYDPQTGLLKMEVILRGVEDCVKKLHTTGKTFAFFQVEIDHLHRIRESLGHEAGASALREIARRLDTRLSRGDLLTRYTGDGFAILLHDCVCEEDALRQGSAFLQIFEQPFKIIDYCVQITASIGISFGSDVTTAQRSTLTQAELALRRSRSLGGNRVTSFLPEMLDQQSHSIQMESKMHAALDKESFFLVYQPQVCLRTGDLVGVEALLRWNSPVDGLVMPNKFIPIAEESGLIVQLGAWCLQTACREVMELQQRLGHKVRLAVNVSPKQVHAKGFEEMVEASLKASGLSPECLEIEITEGLLMSHDDVVLKVISSLQKLGVTAAIDDFGMGFSNLDYITRFKVDRLKIDRSFVGRCTSDHSSEMIITSIIFLAQSLGIEIVAEGIETQDQALMLTNLQCDVAQGFLYARPMTVDQVYECSKTFVVPRPMSNSSMGSVAKHQTPARVSESNKLDSSLPAIAAEDNTIPSTFGLRGVMNTAEPSLRPSSSVMKSGAEVLRNSSSDPLVPREPLCRPSKPLRMPGAVRVVTRTVEECTDFPSIM